MGTGQIILNLIAVALLVFTVRLHGYDISWKWYNSKWFWHAFERNFATTDGRANKNEYWSFYFNYFIASVALIMIDLLIIQSKHPWLTYIYMAMVFVPSVCLKVRRLHDANRSGWLAVFTYIPVIGSFLMIAIGMMQGSKSTNKFGSVPSYYPVDIKEGS